MTKQFEKNLASAGEGKFIVQKELTQVYVYSTEDFELSFYGYPLTGGEKQLIMTIPSDAHKDVRIELKRMPNGTILYGLINSGNNSHADQPVYWETVNINCSKMAVIPNAAAVMQVFE